MLHPLADYRRQLPMERLGVTLDAAPGFCLVVSYNPGYQSVEGLEGFNASTNGGHRARLPPGRRGGKDPDSRIRHRRGSAAQLVRLGGAIRRLETRGLREVASTRVLVAAARLVTAGLGLRDAARAAMAGPLTDDPLVTAGLFEMIDTYFPSTPG